MGERVRRPFVVFAAALLAGAALASAPLVARGALGPPPRTPAEEAFEGLREAGGGLEGHLAPEIGAYDFVRATGSALLVRDDAGAEPLTRALSFLAGHGAVIGMSPAERAVAAERAAGIETPSPVSELRLDRVVTDLTGKVHVRLDQFYRDLPVFGGEVVVHTDDRGITAVNGTFVPGITLEPVAALPEAQAREIAASTVAKTLGDPGIEAVSAQLSVYRTGLLPRVAGENRLAWDVEVTGTVVDEQVFVDATAGTVLDRISLTHRAKDRCVYTPTYDPTQPDAFVARREGDPPSHVPPVDNLYEYTGQTYDLFQNAFGRDSFDGAGAKMRTVYFVDPACPNAFYRSRTQATYYCPGLDLDDVVAHEWAHGYTDYTHDLIYAWQAGALNESYSDIWGEIVDLHNGVDGIGGSNNTEPWPNGQRWIVGEDLTEPVHDALLLRDMWNPERLGLPAKVSSTSYFCGTGDNGGVHYNSSVPNHAFAMLVDGKTFNETTVGAIGMTKAAHIYWQAQFAYQTPTTSFAGHDQALQASCNDLRIAATDLRSLTTGQPTGEIVTAGDCQQVANAMLAVEMSAPPVQCGFQPLLAKSPPPVCGGAENLVSEGFEAGLGDWTTTSVGSNPATWPGHNWAVRGNLPGGRAGQAAFAVDPTNPGGGGHFTLDSPVITVPAGTASTPKVRFDHYVDTESGFDGGNLKVSVNGGAFAPVVGARHVYNPPNSTLGGGNPLAGQSAWSGADGGAVTGSWGTTVVDLSGLVSAGATLRLRFDFGIDGSNGDTGWFVDDVRLDMCPPVPPPTLALGSDYGNPDTDGAYTLEWTRPAGATGPDELQEALVTAPIIADDSEAGLGNWSVSTTGPGQLGWDTSSSKPNHGSTAFFARPNEATFFVLESEAMMTWKDPIAVPATGLTTLTFDEWNMNEPDDGVFVDVSEDGVRWTTVWSDHRSGTLSQEISAFQSEPLQTRSVDVSAFAGQAVHLRFRYQIGYTNYVQRTPLGWYVDNVRLDNLTWQTVTSTSATSFGVSGRAPGTYLYRARSSFTFGTDVVPGEWSNVVTAQVA